MSPRRSPSELRARSFKWRRGESNPRPSSAVPRGSTRIAATSVAASPTAGSAPAGVAVPLSEPAGSRQRLRRPSRRCFGAAGAPRSRSRMAGQRIPAPLRDSTAWKVLLDSCHLRCAGLLTRPTGVRDALPTGDPDNVETIVAPIVQIASCSRKDASLSMIVARKPVSTPSCSARAASAASSVMIPATPSSFIR